MRILFFAQMIASLSALFMAVAPGATLADTDAPGDGFWIVGNGSYVEKCGESLTVALYRGDDAELAEYSADLDEIMALLSELGYQADAFRAGQFDADYDYFAMA